MHKKADQILEYWFGDVLTLAERFSDQNKLWYGKSDETDQYIQKHFEQDIELAREGAYQDWLSEPRGRLAIIILLDQFSRNCYRNSARAFVNDALALEISLGGITLEHDTQLSLYERMFFYLPLEHSEDKEMQAKMVGLAQQLLQEAPADGSAHFQSFLQYAVRHKEIIDQFDRFPHRNIALSRSSSDQELEFLEQPNSSF